MNIVHEIGDVTTEWLLGYRPRSKVIARDTFPHAGDHLVGGGGGGGGVVGWGVGGVGVGVGWEGYLIETCS